MNKQHLTASASATDTGTYPIEHWIDGLRVATTGDLFTQVTDPATGQVTAAVPTASDDDVRAAVDAAKAAFPQWARTSLAGRARVLFAFRELLNDRADELAAIITAEHGKVLADAAGEVARGQEVVEFACGIRTCSRARSALRPRPASTSTQCGHRWDRSL